jgi:hypothetical protein
MELEASLICLREKEKQLTVKASKVDDLSGGDGQEIFQFIVFFAKLHKTPGNDRMHNFCKMCISETRLS